MLNEDLKLEKLNRSLSGLIGSNTLFIFGQKITDKLPIYIQMSGLNAVRVGPLRQPAKQALIFVHGLGDSGSGWSFFAEFLQRDPAFAHTRFVFPNAPIMNVAANGNYPMPSWFNIYEWSDNPSKFDVPGFVNSLNVVKNFVQEQIDSGIDPQNIVVGGFSQGAALALASAVTLPVKIGGFISLSGFSRINAQLVEMKNNLNIDTPVFHGHGDQDPVISLKLGYSAKEFYTVVCGLRKYTMKVYPGMAHSTCPEEIDAVVRFIKSNLNL